MAFIGLTIHAKIIGGGRPLLPEILSQSDRIGAKSLFDFVIDFRSNFARSASAVIPNEKVQLTLI